MPDREKVIKAMEQCISNEECFPDTCPYYERPRNESGLCWDRLMTDAIILLNEQEAVKPRYNARTNWYECGACHYSMTSGMHCRSELIPAYKVGFCAKCGRGVKWE